MKSHVVPQNAVSRADNTNGDGEGAVGGSGGGGGDDVAGGGGEDMTTALMA